MLEATEDQLVLAESEARHPAADPVSPHLLHVVAVALPTAVAAAEELMMRAVQYLVRVGLLVIPVHQARQAVAAPTARTDLEAQPRHLDNTVWVAQQVPAQAARIKEAVAEIAE